MLKLRFTLMAGLGLMLSLQAPATAQTVISTVYHHSLSGNPNYCDGSPYRHWAVSAASSWLPCGARVRVTHRGRSLVVPIKDRCPSCDLDLSAGAAAYLGVPLDGIARVRITP